MNGLRWQRLKGLYFQAMELGPLDRGSFLEDSCAEDDELRTELERLLSVQDHIGGFLEHPDGGSVRRASELPPPSPLRRLGEFELHEELGAGAMGRVFRAHQSSLSRDVAIKVMQPGLTLSTRQVDRFRLEATAAAKLRHPNIVTVHAVGEDSGVHYYAMDLIEGPSLAHVLDELRAAEAPELSEGYRRLLGESTVGYAARIAQVVAELAEALQYSHDHHVLHRDVKPGNVLIDADGRPHLTDFGLAKDLDLESLYHSGHVAGTPFYMSPEQARSAAPVDHRTDVFSLGVVLYELLTLERPFRGETSREVFHAIQEREPRRIRQLNPRVPRDLEVICAKALEKDAGQRYATARDLAQDLRCFLSHESIRARPPSPLERVRRTARRHRRLLETSLLVAAALVLGVFAAGRWARSEVFAAGTAEVQEVLADPATPLGALVRARERLHARMDDAPGADELAALAGALDTRIEAVAHAHRVAGLDSIRTGVEQIGSGGPNGGIASLMSGLKELHLGVRAIAGEDPDTALVELDALDPRVRVDTGGVAAEAFLDRLDPNDGTVLERRSLGAVTGEAVTVGFGYWRVHALAPGLGHAERTLVLDRLEHTEEVRLHLRPHEVVTADMVRIEAGAFDFGTGSVGISPYPRERRAVAGFYIDRTEVSNGDFRAFVQATGHRAPWTWSQGYDEAWDDLPVVGVNYYDAQAYATWAGKRLPTIVEWERAARGTDGWLYPWSVTPGVVAEYANAGRPGKHRLLPKDEMYVFDRDVYLANVRPVDSFPEGRSPDGLHHVLGNVSEWTESLFRCELPGNRFVPQASSRVVKGGSWEDVDVTLDVDEQAPADNYGRGLGFRCAKSIWP